MGWKVIPLGLLGVLVEAIGMRTYWEYSVRQYICISVYKKAAISEKYTIDSKLPHKRFFQIEDFVKSPLEKHLKVWNLELYTRAYK